MRSQYNDLEEIREAIKKKVNNNFYKKKIKKKNNYCKIKKKTKLTKKLKILFQMQN